MDRSFPTVRPMTTAERLSEGRRLPVVNGGLSVVGYIQRNTPMRKKRQSKGRTVAKLFEELGLTVELDHRATAERRWCDVPAGVREEIDRLASLCARHASGAETTESMDAIVNEWLEPYGIAQRSVWDRETRELTIEMTTLESFHAP